MRGKAYWIDQLGEKWALNLKDILRDPYMDKLINFLAIEYSLGQVYPQYMEDIFKAFKMCPWDDVKVVIIGEEPHFTSGYEALAYSDKYIHAYHNGSLTSVAKCIEREYYNGLTLDFDYSLESWAKQGVLLLNRSITVKANNVGSHRRPWNKFFMEVIKLFIQYKPGTVFIFWGEGYEDITKLLENQYVFSWEHPYKALEEKRDWNCPNFKQANEILINLYGGTGIKW